MTNTWLIYALGGGWGHLTRALSLGRIAATRSQVIIITNSPYASQIDHENCIVRQIGADAGFVATCSQVRKIITQTKCDRLIIDTFPRGLGGELADILPELHHIPRILIHRDINPHYVHTKQLRSFVTANFDSVIVPGEGEDLAFCDLPCAQHTAPWLIRHDWELAQIQTVRSRILKVDLPIKTILICAGGKTSELSGFGQIALQLHQNFPDCAVRILAATCPPTCPQTLWVSHHPGIECLAAADIVVGGAGYNTVYECGAVGVPLVALALPRLYDRQKKRACQSYWVKDIKLSDIHTTITTLLNQIQPNKKPSTPSYINGAIQAAQHIEQISQHT